MLRSHRTTFAFLLITAAFALTACQATSTAKPYSPSNCAMVGSSCGRTHHFF
jgi:hypothetical protein